jgi:hypothetical protein
MKKKKESEKAEGSRTAAEVTEHYEEYQSKPEQIRRRARHNAIRAKLEKEGRVKKGDDKEIAHKRAVKHGGSDGEENIKVVDRTTNRKEGTKYA